MRMRFCATMRRPAFSISALTAPVRLRAVASGLMIEKVRSIAMVFGPQINGMWSWPRLYRWLARRASAAGAVAPCSNRPDLQQFRDGRRLPGQEIDMLRKGTMAMLVGGLLAAAA